MSELLESRLQSAGVIAILRKIPVEYVTSTVQALVDGGVGIIEVTLDSEKALEIIQTLRERFSDVLIIGAGTVMTHVDAVSAIKSGAQFLVSPHFDSELFQASVDLGTTLIPGVLSPSEVASAKRAGARLLKLFPAGNLSPSYLRDLLGPFSGTAFIPTGGITPDLAPDYIRAGAVAVGLGSALIPKTDMLHGNWERISEATHRLCHAIRLAKDNKYD